MRAVYISLLASGVSGARIETALQDDLVRDSADPLADVELPEPQTLRQRRKDRISFSFIRQAPKMGGTPYDETFCSFSTDGCATVDGFPGHNSHTELRLDQAAEELAKVPEREVRGEIVKLGDLGYLIFNHLLWHKDWNTFPIGADLADHRKGRPVADALMGHDSGAWSRDMIRQKAEEFFEGRNSLNQRDMTKFNTKLLHKIMLNLDLTDKEEEFFNSYKGSSTVIATVPRWLSSGLRWVFGLNQARMNRDALLTKYIAAMDDDTRGLYPRIEDPRDKRFAADLILTALTSAGGLSVPSVMGISMGILHGAETYGTRVVPEDFTLTNRNVEQFVLESIRRFPVVVGFPWWSPDQKHRTVMNLAMTLRDPRAWEAPKEFRLRPLSEYHEKRGTGTKIGLAWGQQAIGENGLTPDSRGCPGQHLSVVIISEFLKAYLPHHSEWSVGEAPSAGLQITEGVCAANDYTLVRNGHAPDSPKEQQVVTPAPENDDEAAAEAMVASLR